ncbi:unnamed protein product [Phytophthora fragariaefolia]|uniref:Unnamed protein product n=1 Tax=Phytophthora fragariaefolia TaxID=1490495 RepID=A0A9W6UDG6_9STRA|nr:unnamed protein product [Phytophthora fragariaefolia]
MLRLETIEVEFVPAKGTAIHARLTTLKVTSFLRTLGGVPTHKTQYISLVVHPWMPAPSQALWAMLQVVVFGLLARKANETGEFDWSVRNLEWAHAVAWGASVVSDGQQGHGA